MKPPMVLTKIIYLRQASKIKRKKLKNNSGKSLTRQNKALGELIGMICRLKGSMYRNSKEKIQNLINPLKIVNTFHLMIEFSFIFLSNCL